MVDFKKVFRYVRTCNKCSEFFKTPHKKGKVCFVCNPKLRAFHTFTNRPKRTMDFVRGREIRVDESKSIRYTGFDKRRNEFVNHGFEIREKSLNEHYHDDMLENYFLHRVWDLIDVGEKPLR